MLLRNQLVSVIFIEMTVNNNAINKTYWDHGLYSLSGQTSCRKTSRNLEAARFKFKLSNYSKFDKHLCSTAAEMPAKFQSDTIFIISNLEAPKLREIWRHGVLPLSE